MMNEMCIRDRIPDCTLRKAIFVYLHACLFPHAPYPSLDMLQMCIRDSYRTVHFDIVELAVIDQTAKKTGFDFFEELYFLVIVLKTVADGRP